MELDSDDEFDVDPGAPRVIASNRWPDGRRAAASRAPRAHDSLAGLSAVGPRGARADGAACI